MCCVVLIQRKNKHSNEMYNMRVLFRCDLKWQTLQPPTLQKYHQFTVFRHRKKSNRVCVTQLCVNTQHPTHAIGVKNNFPFPLRAHCNLPLSTQITENERQQKCPKSENSLSLFLGWQFRQHSEFSKTASGFLAFLFRFRRC